MGVPSLPRLLRGWLHHLLQLRAVPQGGEREVARVAGRPLWAEGASCCAAEPRARAEQGTTGYAQP